MSPTFFVMLSGTSDIRPADSNLLAPAVGGAAGLVDAAFGASFLDPTTGLAGDFAIHDMVFGANGVFPLFSNPLGPLGLQGDLAWTLATGILEMSTNIGIGGTAFVPNTPSISGGLFRNETQYSELSPGVFEVVMPFLFSIGLSSLPGPFSSSAATLSFQGEIVATNVIPEPGTGLLLGLGLVTIAARRRARSPR